GTDLTAEDGAYGRVDSRAIARRMSRRDEGTRRHSRQHDQQPAPALTTPNHVRESTPVIKRPRDIGKQKGGANSVGATAGGEPVLELGLHHRRIDDWLREVVVTPGIDCPLLVA